MPYLPADPQAVLRICAALTSGTALLWLFARHARLGVTMLLGAQVWAAATDRMPCVDLGVQIYPADVLAGCALCVGLGRLLARGFAEHGSPHDGAAPRRAGLALLLVFVALTAWSSLCGAADFGLEAAGNDARTYFWHVLAAALYTATFPPSAALGRGVTLAWLASAIAYGALCLVGWAGGGLHSVVEYSTVDGVTVDSRPVHAASALVLLQASALLLYPLYRPTADSRPAPPGPRRARTVGALALVVFVVLLQHRTVWVAAAVMVVVWWALRPTRPGQRLVAAATAGTALCATALAYLAGAFGSVGGTLAESARETQGTHSTIVWRLEGWQQLLDTPRTVGQWLAGAPFGSGYDRYIEGGLVSVSPHNYYVHVGLRLGLVGLVVLLALYGSLWRQLARDRRRALALCLAVAAQLVFFLTYPAFPEQGVILGLCLWYARTGGGARTRQRVGPASVGREPDHRAAGRAARPRRPLAATVRPTGCDRDAAWAQGKPQKVHEAEHGAPQALNAR